MLRAFLLPIGLFAAALAGCGSGAAAANDNKPLPALTGRVVDGADLLPPKDEARLADRLAALERHCRVPLHEAMSFRHSSQP